MAREALSVATIGHHGDGKTTLLSAVTHVLAEEPGYEAQPTTVAELDRRAIPPDPRRGYQSGSVELRATEYVSGSRRYAHLDLPGRRSLTRAVPRGLAIADAALLVISAEHGVRSQTREHAVMARACGVEQFILFINRCDVAADATTIDVVELEARELLADLDLDGDDVPVVRGSALRALEDERWRQTVLQLVGAMETKLRCPIREPDRPALLMVDELFGSDRPHRLVAGRVFEGTFTAGTTYRRIGLGPDQSVVARSIQRFKVDVDRAEAGQQVGLMLTGGSAAPYRRGQIICADPKQTAAARFSANVYLLTQDQGGRHTPIFPGHCPHFHLGTAGVTGRMNWEGTVGLSPGETGQVSVELLETTYLQPGMRFLIRDGCDGLRRKLGGPPRWSGTAGWGEIVSVG